MSLSSLTMIEQTSFSLRFAIDRLQLGMNNLYRSLESVRNLYAKIDAHLERVKVEAMKDAYPSPSKAAQRGMEIELRYALILPHDTRPLSVFMSHLAGMSVSPTPAAPRTVSCSRVSTSPSSLRLSS